MSSCLNPDDSIFLQATVSGLTHVIPYFLEQLWTVIYSAQNGTPPAFNQSGALYNMLYHVSE